jgi:hypothetical protein
MVPDANQAAVLDVGDLPELELDRYALSLPIAVWWVTTTTWSSPASISRSARID